MRMLGRTYTVLGLACLAQAPSLSAQITGFETFKWYVGAQAGATIFETPTQTKGAIFTAGGHLLVTAKRTGLLVSVEQGFGKNESSSYEDASVTGGTRAVNFTDIRKYSFILLAFPLKSAAQPYLGLGFGYLHTRKEDPAGPFATSAERANAVATAHRLGGYGFATAVGGLQFRVDRFVLFGQYQITSSPSDGHLITGPTHTFTGGIRFSLGNAREGVEGHGGS
jgi:hypothetical protein